MKPLTLENAGELESGEVYRVGIHDHNFWEMFIVFERVDHYEYDLGQADLYEHLLKTGALKQEPDKYPLTKHIDSLRKLWVFGWRGERFGEQIEAIDRGGFGEKPTRIAYESDSVSKQIYDGCDDSYFCSGSGAEPLWILEDGETCEDIPRARIRSMEEVLEITQCK